MYFDIIKSGTLKGVYTLNGTGSRFNYLNEMTGRPYYDSANNPFTVTIKKDTIEGGRHIVSGAFNGTLYDAIPDYVRITGGVFDVTVN